MNDVKWDDQICKMRNGLINDVLVETSLAWSKFKILPFSQHSYCTFPFPRSFLSKHGPSSWLNRFACAYQDGCGGWQTNYMWAQNILVKVSEVCDIGNASNEWGNFVCNTLTLCTLFITNSNNISSRQNTSESCRSLTEHITFWMMVLLQTQ